MKKTTIHILNKLNYALVIPSHVARYDGWLEGSYAQSVKFEGTEYLLVQYNKVLEYLKLAKYYKLHKRIEYYNRVLWKLKRELAYREDLWENDRITYIEKYGALV